jgi:hypothetical protein
MTVPLTGADRPDVVGALLTVTFGIAIYYGVQKFFKDLEEKLSEDTRLRVTVWLLDAKAHDLVEPWPRTLGRLFDRVFGTSHFSWQCFRRSCLASLIAVGIVAAYIAVPTAVNLLFKGHGTSQVVIPAQAPRPAVSMIAGFAMLLAPVVVSIFVANLIPDYISLLETRWALRRMQVTTSIVVQAVILAIDFAVTAVLATIATVLGLVTVVIIAYLPSAMTRDPLNKLLLKVLGNVLVLLPSLLYRYIWFYPAFLTSIWTWLYVASGLVVRGARRVDILLALGNRLLDVEHKPLQAIGLIAALICTVLYWAVSILHFLISAL